MNHKHLFLSLAIFLGFLLVGCNVEITATRPPAGPTAETGGTPAGSNITETITAPGPPAWEALGLTGRLVFIGYDGQDRQHVYLLDLETGALTSVFSAPEEGESLLLEVAASPDGSQLLLAYAPPVSGDNIQFGFADLYTLPSDGSAPPELLLGRADNTETFFNISWPLDDTIYYAHFAPTVGELGETIYKGRVERLPVSAGAPAGEAEILVVDASWPRLSRDGSRLAYVTATNDLVVANPDGSDAQIMIPGDVFPALDAPLFSLDNETLYFSAVETLTPSLSWLDRLMGVRVAEAHNVPSDWWQQPAGEPAGTVGTEAEKLTNLQEIGLYGDISADGDHIAFISTNGVQVMNPDGGGVFRLLNISATGTLNWIWTE